MQFRCSLLARAAAIVEFIVMHPKLRTIFQNRIILKIPGSISFTTVLVAALLIRNIHFNACSDSDCGT
jgi:hypothetical protein